MKETDATGDGKVIDHTRTAYCREGYSVSCDWGLAKKYQPIIYDPYSYAVGQQRYNVPVVYFRSISDGKSKCLQFYYFWEKQDCKDDYIISEPNTVGLFFGLFLALIEAAVANLVGILLPGIFILPGWAHFIISLGIGILIGAKLHNSINNFRPFQRMAGFLIGRYFTHPYDFEPILIFLDNNEVTRVVASGKGDVDSEPHRNDIFSAASYQNSGTSVFYTSDQFPRGQIQSSCLFKEFPLSKLSREDGRPRFAVITCYHAFTANGIYYDDPMFTGEPPKLDLRELDSETLSKWYHQLGFDHDVSDPFGFPYIKFGGAVSHEKSRRSILFVLAAASLFLEGFVLIANSINQRSRSLR